MAEIKSSTIALMLDGKKIEIKNPTKLNLEFNKALIDDVQFSQFISDPAGFAQKFDLHIDPDIAIKLASTLKGLGSVRDLDKLTAGSGATAWAIAQGAYSLASTKIAAVV